MSGPAVRGSHMLGKKRQLFFSLGLRAHAQPTSNPSEKSPPPPAEVVTKHPPRPFTDRQAACPVSSSEALLPFGLDGQFRHGALFRGCVTLFNVKSIYVPRDTSYYRDWAFEAVITKARFQRTLLDEKKTSFTIVSLHCHHAVAKRRSIALNIGILCGPHRRD